MASGHRRPAGREAFGRTRRVDGASCASTTASSSRCSGPSGSGKTTLLRVIAGFEQPDAGRVRDRRAAPSPGDGAWVEPEHRRIGMVFQDGALFPHLTVAGNVGFGARAAPSAWRECLELVGLADRARRLPARALGRRAPADRARARAGRRPVGRAARRAVRVARRRAARLAAPARSRRSCARRARARCSSRTTRPRRSRSPTPSRSCATGRIEQVGHAGGGLRAPAQPLAGRVPRRGRRAARHGARRASSSASSAASARRRSSPASVDVVLRPESVAIGLGAAAPAHAEAVVVARSFYGHDQLVAPRAAERAAPAQPPARLSGLASRRPRARLDRRAGQRARAGQPDRRSRGRARRPPRRTAARRRRRGRCG